MSTIKEYMVVCVTWRDYKKDSSSFRREAELNLEANMQVLESEVNHRLAEGWEPLGAPSFSESWTRSYGKAYQGLVRNKIVEAAVLVVAEMEAVAENVQPLRTSMRRRGPPN